MKPHAHMRPSMSKPYYWEVDCYDWRGAYTGGIGPMTKEKARKKVRRMNRVLNEPEKPAVQCKHKYKNGN